MGKRIIGFVGYMARSIKARMKKILIIAPYFPPSNLAAVHRSRLFAQHLPKFGWEPVILTVQAKYFEETVDENLMQLLSPGLRVERTSAFSIGRPRIIGDIGLRSFFQLLRRAKQLIREEKIDFLYIPIPPFYSAMLGRLLHASTGIPYGIDYIDPWVHRFPGSDKMFSRHWFSTKLARILEPIAVKKARLVTGVASGYYKGVEERNPGLANTCIFGAMPYGGEVRDHQKVEELDLRPYLYPETGNKLRLAYAGAMLPKAYGPMEAMLQSIQANPVLFQDVEFHFIGTGKTPDDPKGYNIRPLAEKYGLWQTVIFEYPKRIPYLDVLIHLQAVDAVFVLGSIESHYTPSKVYQGILSQKPILAILHEASTASAVVAASGAGLVLSFNEHDFQEKIRAGFADVFEAFRAFTENFEFSDIDMKEFSEYSAEKVTAVLAGLLEKTELQ